VRTEIRIAAADLDDLPAWAGGDLFQRNSMRPYRSGPLKIWIKVKNPTTRQRCAHSTGRFDFSNQIPAQLAVILSPPNMFHVTARISVSRFAGLSLARIG
jgi:hypothetical protein